MNTNFACRMAFWAVSKPRGSVKLPACDRGKCESYQSTERLLYRVKTGILVSGLSVVHKLRVQVVKVQSLSRRFTNALLKTIRLAHYYHHYYYCYRTWGVHEDFTDRYVPYYCSNIPKLACFRTWPSANPKKVHTIPHPLVTLKIGLDQFYQVWLDTVGEWG